jgi:hypothetical protein
MRLITAITILGVLFVLVLGFAIGMRIYVGWSPKDISVRLPATTLMAMRLAYLIWCYWYIVVLLFVGIGLGIIALYRR